MTERKTTSICIIILMFLISLSPILNVVEESRAHWIIEDDETYTVENKVITQNEGFTVRGTLNYKNVTLVLNTSEGNIYKVEDGGMLTLRDSEVIPYQQYYRKELTLELKEGENMLSFAFHRVDNSVESVLSPLEGHIESAWYYDPWDEEDHVKIYDPDRSPHFNDLKEVDEDMALIVETNDDIVVNMSGYPRNHVDTTLKEGYNMFSYPFLHEQNVSEVFPDIMSDIDVVKKVAAGEDDLLFNMSYDNKEYLVGGPVNETIMKEFEENDITLSSDAEVVNLTDGKWRIEDGMHLYEIAEGDEALRVYKLTLGPDEIMKPGFGYWVNMKNTRDWSANINGGISAAKAEGFELSTGISLTFHEGSLGSIENTVFHGTRETDSLETTNIMDIQSNSVVVQKSTFIGSDIPLSISHSDPSIIDTSFLNYSVNGLYARDSSFNLYNSTFDSDMGWAVHYENGSPEVVRNSIHGANGIRVYDSRGVLMRNNFSHLGGSGVMFTRSRSFLEKNYFSHTFKSAVRSESSELMIYTNEFYNVGGGIYCTESNLTIHGNELEDVGFGIKAFASTLSIQDNTIKNGSGGCLLISDSDSEIKDNTLYYGSTGIQVSGDTIIAEGNDVKGMDNQGVRIHKSNNFTLYGNTITENGGVGLIIEDADGISNGNSIIDNSGGVKLSSSIRFVNNTVSRNDIYGISIKDSSPFLDTLILSLNENYAVKFENSDTFLKSCSLLGSSYHLYLVSSRITAITSYLDEDKVWMDGESELYLQDAIEVTIKEDRRLDDYDLLEHLPPDTKINSVFGNGSVTVTIRRNTIDIVPPENFSGTVNMTFNVTFSNRWLTTVPLSLEVTPVNDLPVLKELYVNKSYSPDKITWLVSYTDGDNVPPEYIEIVINGDHFPMEEVNPDDNNYADGKLYSFEKYTEPGDYNYYYVAEENNDLGENSLAKTRSKNVSMDPTSPALLNNVWLLLVLMIILLVIVISAVYTVYGSKLSSPKSDIKTDEILEEYREEKEREETESEGDEISRIIETIERDIENLGKKEDRFIEMPGEEGEVSKGKSSIGPKPLPVLKSKRELEKEKELEQDQMQDIDESEGEEETEETKGTEEKEETGGITEPTDDLETSEDSKPIRRIRKLKTEDFDAEDDPEIKAEELEEGDTEEDASEKEGSVQIDIVGEAEGADEHGDDEVAESEGVSDQYQMGSGGEDMDAVELTGSRKHRLLRGQRRIIRPKSRKLKEDMEQEVEKEEQDKSGSGSGKKLRMLRRNDD
ncbi:MAG: right-handed parallel beta-helix repeat-containing protein [Thermoplasmata archaeon]